MENTNMNTDGTQSGVSTWIRTAGALPEYARLEKDITTDVCVVGSGLTGITTAYLLAKSGKKVVLITDETLKETATAYTTGFLSYELDTALLDLEKMFDTDQAQLAWRAQNAAIDHIEDTIKEERIECEFVRCPQYTYAVSSDEFKGLQDEAEEGAKLGFGTSAEKGKDLPFKNDGYMRTERQAKFHALKYASSLKERAKEAGAMVFDHTKALEIQESDSVLHIVKTPHGSITCTDVVEATYYPFTRPKQLFARTGGYITYVMEYSIPAGAYDEMMIEDEHNPYHYLRIDKTGEDRDRLIVGGEDHREEVKMNPEKNFKALEEYIHALLPDADLQKVTRWTGPIIEPLDGLPSIGALSGDEHHYVATGFSGTGMTFSRVAAEVISDKILGRENAYAEVFKATRIPTATALAIKTRDYVGEFVGGAGKNIFKKAE